MKLPELKLPPIQTQIKSKGGETFIFDRIRKKLIVLTPEEWVRQHFIHLLIEHLNYPAGLFQVERGHSYFGSTKRSDILVLDTSGNSLLLVECKSTDVPINESALHQLATYNKTVQARYVCLTNGLKHFIWERKDNEYVQLSRFPVYG
jgi:hypothetical protein